MRTVDQTILLEQAHRLFDSGDLVQSQAMCQRILRQNKGDLKAMRLMGMLAFANGDVEGAIRQFNKCLATLPSAWIIHHDIAQIRLQMGRFDEALSSFNRALKYRPGYSQALAGKAATYERMGDKDAAWAVVQPVLAAGSDDIYIALVAMKLMTDSGRAGEAIDLANRHLAGNSSDPAQRRLLLQELGRLYDKAGDYSKAFDAFTRSNQTSRPFSPRAYVEAVDGLLEAFSASNMKSLPRSTSDSELPVFIACMPRSGSTLVDQIVHSHPQAYGSGEMETLISALGGLRDRLGTLEAYPYCMSEVTTNHLDEMASTFVEAIQRLDRKSIRITNKHLHNYKHLGMFSLIFPKARIIHIHRDPMDNCLGIYMASLDLNRNQWVSDLRNLGLVYRQYQRLMDHWKQTIENPILDVKYEDLVDDPDGWIRRIIEFCGLPWDDKCLRYYEADRAVLTLSYDQVRRPIFKTAVNRAQRYAAFLGPLKAALAGDADLG